MKRKLTRRDRKAREASLQIKKESEKVKSLPNENIVEYNDMKRAVLEAGYKLKYYIAKGNKLRLEFHYNDEGKGIVIIEYDGIFVKASDASNVHEELNSQIKRAFNLDMVIIDDTMEKTNNIVSIKVNGVLSHGRSYRLINFTEKMVYLRYYFVMNENLDDEIADIIFIANMNKNLRINAYSLY